jgi:DNA-binding response OmpR family regulator
MAAAQNSNEGAGKRKILLVDDEPDVLATFRAGLENYGFTVDSFTDPEEALVKFKPHAYDLLLLDVNMPKMDGFKLFQKLQERDPDVNVCFVTAYETYFEAFRELFPELDVGCFIRKPVSLGDLGRQMDLKVHRRMARQKDSRSIGT